MKNIQYNGNHLFNINMGLYNFDDIDFDKSKDNILKNFTIKYFNTIKKEMDLIGIKLIKFIYFSPQTYNFTTDSIDVIITIKDKNKLKTAILSKKKFIQKLLDENKSYDGYMALTVDTVEEELKKLEDKNYEIDILVLKGCLNLKINFNKEEYFIYESDEIE